MKRTIRCVVAALCLAECVTAAAAPTTYAEVVAECAALFAPLVPVEQAQALVPRHGLGAAADIRGNSAQCSAEFKQKDGSHDKPGSGTPLLMYSVSHGGDARTEFADHAKLARGMAKKTFADADAARYPGVDKAMSYTAFGRHWLLLLQQNTVVTLQVVDTYPAATLDTFAALVLDAVDSPALAEWRARR
jgi:hypothetical protein